MTETMQEKITAIFGVRARKDDGLWRVGSGIIVEARQTASRAKEEYDHHLRETLAHHRKLVEQANVIKRFENAPPLDMTPLCKTIVDTFATVERALFRKGHLLILTTHLVAKDTEGSFDDIIIEPHVLDINLEECYSRFIPVGENLYEGYDQSMVGHPHVIHQGSLEACLGSFGGVFLEQLRNDQFIDAVETVLTFLQSFSSDDPAGRTARRWPTFTPELQEVA
jgi:hypothetical protein